MTDRPLPPALAAQRDVLLWDLRAMDLRALGMGDATGDDPPWGSADSPGG